MILWSHSNGWITLKSIHYSFGKQSAAVWRQPSSSAHAGRFGVWLDVESDQDWWDWDVMRFASVTINHIIAQFDISSINSLNGKSTILKKKSFFNKKVLRWLFLAPSNYVHFTKLQWKQLFRRHLSHMINNRTLPLMKTTKKKSTGSIWRILVLHVFKINLSPE